MIVDVSSITRLPDGMSQDLTRIDMSRFCHGQLTQMRFWSFAAELAHGLRLAGWDAEVDRRELDPVVTVAFIDIRHRGHVHKLKLEARRGA